MKEIKYICDVCRKEVGSQGKIVWMSEEKYLVNLGDWAEVCLECFCYIKEFINKEATKYGSPL